MSMLTRRLQILIDEERYRRLAARAREEGVSVATVVRRAIDAVLPTSSSRKRRAWERILAAEPIPVPDDPDDLDREIDEDRMRGWERS
jgi:hypothetical protein